MDLQEQLKAFGHARVIVVLKPRKTRRRDGHRELALAETIDLQQDVAQQCGKYFRPFADSRTQLIANDLHRGRGAAPDRAGMERAIMARTTTKARPAFRYFRHLGVMFGTVDRKGLNRLIASKSAVASVLSPPEFSLIAPHPVTTADAMAEGPTWGLRRLGIPGLWERGIYGDGVLIGHLDTGVDATHPALANAVDVFAEFDSLGEIVPSAATADTGIHGTHTAGILVGQPFKGAMFGVAPKAKLAAAVVIEGGDVPARVLGALDWCVEQSCRVINMSLGIRGYEPLFEDILDLLRERNILPVAAVGNEGPLTSRSPGNHLPVVSVGAIDDTDHVWWSSSSQRVPGKQRVVPDLVTPGVAVWSSVPGGSVKQLSGTSMAAPHVAGLAALLMSHRPDASVAMIEEAIYRSCRRPANASTIRANRGIPDGDAARTWLEQNT